MKSVIKNLKEWRRFFELGNAKLMTGSALFIVVIHPIFFIICTAIEQPYENGLVRFLLSVSAIPLLFWKQAQKTLGIHTHKAYDFLIFVNTLVFIPWMYFMNGTPFWLSTVCVITVVEFTNTHWKQSLLRLATGIGIAFTIAFLQNAAPSITPSDIGAIFFALLGGFWFSVITTSNKNKQMSDSNLLLGVLAHDLRTPVQTIELLSGTLINYTPKTDVKNIAIRLNTAARSMNNIIDDQISNAHMHNDERLSSTIVVSEIIQQSATEYTESIEDPASIKLDVISDFKVFGSTTQIKRVILNIIKNSHQGIQRKSKTRGGAIAIEINVSDEIGEIRISDNGCGIKQMDLEHIYRPFFSTSPSKSSGLGLYYVRHVVEDLMRGKVRAISEVGKGTTIILSFSLSLQKQN